MNGNFSKSLEQLKRDIQKEVINNGRNNHCGNADNKRIQPMENQLLSNEKRTKIL